MRASFDETFEDFKMYENFISDVRKRLNTKVQRKQPTESGSTKAHSKTKSAKFEEYKSENVFEPDQLFPTKSKNVSDCSNGLAKPNKIVRTRDLLLVKEKRAEAHRRRNGSRLSNNSINELTPSKSELEDALTRQNSRYDYTELPPANSKDKDISSTESNIGISVKRKRKKKRSNKVSATITSLESGVAADTSTSDNTTRRNSLDNWKSFSDIGNLSLTKDSSDISDSFAWNQLAVDESENSIRHEEENTPDIEDSNEMDYDFEKASKDASFSEMSVDNVDFGYSFLARNLKNVKIRSGTICDEDSSSKSLLASYASSEITDNNFETVSMDNLSIIELEDENTLSNDSLADLSKDQRGKIDIASTNTVEANRCINQKSTNTTYISVDSDRLIILKRGEAIPLFGICALKVLYGKLEVLGYILDEESDEINVYSPRGSALLYLRNVTIAEAEATQKEFCFSNFTLENTDVVIRCSNLNDTRISFIERYISQQIFPNIYNNDPRVVFEPKENMPVINIGIAWNAIIDSITSQSRLLVAGGKGVGKSTFLRYAINRLLCKYNKIRVIDLDTGQSEFAVPGCISVLTLSEPVFGPNYTHLRKPDRSYLSNINVGTDPRSYINCIKLLMDYVHTLDHIPTLVNYMGFVKGIGLNIISSAITFVKPTDVIQINSINKKNNFNTNLSLSNVGHNCNLFGNGGLDFDMRVHILDAMNDKNDGWSLEPRQMRELTVLAYLGQMVNGNDVLSLTSDRLPMFKVNLSAIRVADIYGNDLQPAAINANLVAMCNKNVNSKIFTCLGFGVVRGIDLTENYLVLMTPENPLILNKVEYLVLTSVLLPPSIYMCPDDVEGEIPYVMDAHLVSLAKITRRSYLPADRK